MNSDSLLLEKNKPLLILDGWRGVAVLWVVMFHAISPFLHTPGKQIFAVYPLYWISSFGGTGVVLFFVISGYCITGAMINSLLKENSAEYYIKSRIKRIYPPYLMALILYSFTNYSIILAKKYNYISIVNHEYCFNQSWFFWISNFLLIQHEFKQSEIVPVAWSLCYEMAFYVVLGLILLLLSALKRHSFSMKKCIEFLSIIIFLLTLCSIIWLCFSPGTCPFPFQLWYQFGAGSLLYMTSLNNHQRSTTISGIVLNSKIQLFITILLIIYFALVHKDCFHRMIVYHRSIDGHAADPIQPLVTILFILSLYAMKPFDAKIAQNILFQQFIKLGVVSYSLYLIHTLIQPFIDFGLRKVGFDNYSYFPNYLLQVVIPVAFSIPFYILIEKRFLSSRRLQITNEEKIILLKHYEV